MITSEGGIEGEPPAVRCAYCARWAASVVYCNGERLCGPCESLFRKVEEAQREQDELRKEGEQLILERQGLSQRADGLHHSYLAVTRERDEALRQATALHQSLVTVTVEREAAHAEAVGFGAKVVHARQVAAWLLQEWTDPAGWSDVIAAAEAKFGMLDWLREGKT